MVVVYVWDFQGSKQAWGHASMWVGTTYISWWPDSPGQVPSKIHRNIYQSHPLRGRSFAEDVRSEGRSPNHCIHIDGLDESAIKDWWQSFGLSRDGVLYQGPLPAWATLKCNCSTVVATALKRGGGDRYVL